MFRTTVPEATVNEYRDASAGKDDVRTYTTLGQVNAEVASIPKPRLM